MNEAYIIRKNDFKVPGVKGHHTVMHISDSHLCYFDETSSDEEIKYAKDREAFWKGFKYKFAKVSGDNITKYNDLSTIESFDNVLLYAEQLQPELLIISGDSLEIMSSAGAKYLKNKLDSYKGNYICVPGNHEDGKIEGVWDENPKVYKGNGFNFIGIDNSKKTVSNLTLNKLHELIDETTPLFPVYHMPISTSYNRDITNIFDEYFIIDENTEDKNGCELVKLLRDSDVVKATFCGHTHVYNESYIISNKKQICCSSSMIGNIHLIDIHE